jgi:hypothetical protein
MRCKYSQDWLLATNNPDPDPDSHTTVIESHAEHSKKSRGGDYFNFEEEWFSLWVCENFKILVWL